MFTISETFTWIQQFYLLLKTMLCVLVSIFLSSETEQIRGAKFINKGLLLYLLMIDLVMQGHREYLEASKSKEKGPWKKYELRSVEFCRITNLEYHIEPGGGTSCKLELEFIDTESSACGYKFQLTWPELTDYPDFLVEKSRFDASMTAGWVARDHCKVWWASENGTDDKGQWWEGRIKTIKAKSDDFPDSPWEKYIVTYKSSAEPQAHSPWELFDRSCSIPGWIVPQIEEDERDELLQAIYDIEESLPEDKTVCVFFIL